MREITFLKTVATWARHHSVGNLTVWMERPNITCIMDAISSRSSFSRSGLSLSGSAAFCKSFGIPATEILNSSITGIDFSTPGGNASKLNLPQSAIS